VLIGILVLSVYVPVTAPEGEMVPLIFETTDKQGLRNVIEAAGGIVTIEYTSVDMLAAEVPVTSVGSVLESSYIVEAWKDNLRYIPDPPEAEGEGDVFEAQEVLDLSDYTIESVTVEDMEDLPDNYYNFLITGAETVWEDTYYGDGTVVAVIDTGTYPWHPCFMWPDDTSSVIGGKSFAPGEDPDSWGDPDNHYHGTVCGGLIASHCGVLLPKSDPLAQSVMLYAPPESYEDLGDYIILWLFGMAPLSEIYAIKVFPKDGSGVPSSVVMQGIDHAICMRQLYEDTCGAEGVPIDVISMSLGGGTGYDGNDPEDLLVDSATKQGIVVVAAAGNSGPAFNTVETPGCANTSISVGAAADPVHTRVGWDFIYGLPGIGEYFYPYDEVQIIYFSSRGPTSDGRLAPNVVACGVYAMSLFPPDSIGIMSGTSASTPIVAGGAALLCSWQKYNPEALGPPGCSASQWPKQGPKPDCPECPDPQCPNLTFANPYQIRNALIEGALPLEIPYPEYAQGNGYLNMPASLDLLQNCIDGGLHLQSNHKYDVVDLKGGTQTWSTGTLGPGRTYDITIAVDEDTQQIDVHLSNVTIPGPPNPLMGDSIEFYIQSSVRTYGYPYIHSANITSASSFTITDPHPGNMRITVEGDWTNWGTVSCDVTVTETEGRSLCGLHAKDSLGNDEWHIHYVNVPSGTGCVIFKLWWKHDWSKWPTYDLDMYVIDPNGYVYVGGAQFWSPEKQTIVYPVPGTYTVLIYGYDIYHGRDSYWLRVCYIC
jgi:subtilisin family serine protease